MGVTELFGIYKWLGIAGLALFGLVKYGHKWLDVMLHHKREMLRINLKEAARKEDLKRKAECILAKRTAKGKVKR
jgi:hypothetical protein